MKLNSNIISSLLSWLDYLKSLDIYMLFCVLNVLLIALIISFLDTLSVTQNFNKDKLIRDYNLKKKSIYLKVNKRPYFYRQKRLICELKNYYPNNVIITNKYFNQINFVLFSFLILISTFSIVLSITKIYSLSIIISTLFFFVPQYLVGLLLDFSKKNLQKEFVNYLINLRNYTKTKNDIIEAFKRADTNYPLKQFVERFSLSVDKGYSVYESFERLKKDINIKRIGEFITNLQFCHINGGDFSELITKYIQIFTKVKIQREKENQETYSTKIVLAILFFVNIYVLFSFALQNEEYRKIMTQTNSGIMILNFNVISYILIVFLIIKMNKVEE